MCMNDNNALILLSTTLYNKRQPFWEEQYGTEVDDRPGMFEHLAIRMCFKLPNLAR